MKAHKFLRQKDLDFEIVEQENPTKTCDDAAQERGVDISQIVKSLIVERHEEKGLEEGELIHLLLPGDREISEKKFGENHLVSPEKSKKLTGFESGTVHPFSTEIDHLIDYRIFENNRVSFTVGEELKGIIIDIEEFEEAVEKANFEYGVKDISLTEEEDIQELKKSGLNRDNAIFVAEKGLAPIYLNLNYEDDYILKAFHELLRHDVKPEETLVSDLIEAADNLSHLQKLVEIYAETGKIEDQDSFELEEVITNIFEEHPEALQDLNSGKNSVENFVIGQVMQRTSGKADPAKVKEVLKNEYRENSK